jgi:hypothetical protein
VAIGCMDVGIKELYRKNPVFVIIAAADKL